MILLKNINFCKKFFVFFFVLSLFLTPAISVFGSSSSDGGASEAEGIGTSFYDVSTALSAYANSVVGSNTNDKHADHQLREMKGLSPGVGGAFVGYGDSDRGFYAFISSNTAHSVTTSSYDAWSNVGDDGSTYAYVRYGYLLNDLGLDDAATEGGDFGRIVFGWFMRAVHAIAGLIPQLFGLCLTLLRLLNPFKFLTSSVVNSYGVLYHYRDQEYQMVRTGSGTNVGSMLGDSVSDSGVFGSIAQVISDLYTRLQFMGIYVIVPLLIAFLLFSILMQRHNGQSVSRKVLIFLERFAFIVVGVPICALLYTSAVDEAYSIVSDEPPASQLVASTFVDFQGWVTNGRLGLPDYIELVSSGLDSDTGDASTTAGAASSDTVRALRYYVYELNRGVGLVPDGSSNPIGVFDPDRNSGPYGYFYGNVWDTNGFVDNLVGDDATSKRVGGLLSRYSGGNRYQASAWETAVNGTMSKKYSTELGATPSTANATSNDGMIYGMYDYTDDASDWLDREVADNTNIFEGHRYNNGGDWSGKAWNIFSNGDLVASVTTDVKKDIVYKNGWNGTVQDGTDPNTTGGLSSISMYNYLSTDFTDSSVSVYSSVKSTSEYVKPSHFSVNLIGSGVLRTLYGANCVAVLGIFVIIGLFYGFGMVISNLTRGVRLLLQIPGAMFGILRSIVQIIVYTLVMIMELLGTIFMYVVFTDLIIMFATVIEKPIAKAVMTPSVVVGGRIANVGVLNPDVFYGNTLFFVFGMFVVIGMLLFSGYKIVKYHRVFLVVWEACWCKIFRLVTCQALRPAFDDWMKNRVSLYVWDMSELSLIGIWGSLFVEREGVNV